MGEGGEGARLGRLPVSESRDMSLAFAAVFGAAVGREGGQVLLQEAVWRETQRKRNKTEGEGLKLVHTAADRFSCSSSQLPASLADDTEPPGVTYSVWATETNQLHMATVGLSNRCGFRLDSGKHVHHIRMYGNMMD